MKNLVFAVCASALILGTALPGEAIAQSRIAPEKAAIIDEIIGLLNMDAAIARGFEATSQQMAAQIRLNDPSVPEGKIRIIVEVAEEATRLVVPESLKLMRPLMAEVYSLDELQQLAAFYRTPLGQKSIHAMPLVMQRAQEAMPALAQKIDQYMQENLPGRLRAAGYRP